MTAAAEVWARVLAASSAVIDDGGVGPERVYLVTTVPCQAAIIAGSQSVSAHSAVGGLSVVTWSHWSSVTSGKPVSREVTALTLIRPGTSLGAS